MSYYTPEVGQALFGQPYQEHECPEYVRAALRAIAEELDRVMWNVHQERYDSPFDNSGNVEGFACPVFEVHAYDWSDDNEQRFNFKWKDLAISWYKHSYRGLSMNRETTPDECATMLHECIVALAEYEKQMCPGW